MTPNASIKRGSMGADWPDWRAVPRMMATRGFTSFATEELASP
jgi:hypothetical protein